MTRAFVIVMKLVPNDPWVVFKKRNLTMSNSVDVDIKKEKEKQFFPLQACELSQDLYWFYTRV